MRAAQSALLMLMISHIASQERYQVLKSTGAVGAQLVPIACRQYIVKDFPLLQDLAKQGKSASMGKSGGAWSACTHLYKYGLNFAPFYARFLAFELRPISVMEFGCGLGLTADFLARHVPGGSRVICIEPEPMLGDIFASSLSSSTTLRHQQTEKYTSLRRFPKRPLQLGIDIFSQYGYACSQAFSRAQSKFELVLSLEVAEHLSSSVQQKLIDWLSSVCGRYLVFSAARPGQNGTGHISHSMQTPEWWIHQFELRGLIYLPALTDALRETAIPERDYDLALNTVVLGAPAHFNKNQSTSSISMPPLSDCTYFLQVDCPRPLRPIQNRYRGKHELQEQRRAWVEGQCQALWPELDLQLKKIKTREIRCSEN